MGKDLVMLRQHQLTNGIDAMSWRNDNMDTTTWSYAQILLTFR